MGDVAGATIDATGQTFSGTYGVVLSLARSTFLDGFITRADLDAQTTPWSTWHATTGLTTRNDQPTICRTRFANVGDGISISAQGTRRSADFTVCGVEMTDVHDDAIENDTMQAGAVYDCLIDGAVVFLSCRYGSPYTPPDGTGHRVHVERCLVRLVGFANSYNVAKYGTDTHGPIFKWASPTNPGQGIPPAVDLVDCTFAAGTTSPYGTLSPPPNCTATGITLIWYGEGEWPHLSEWRAICPNVSVLHGREHWDILAATWRGRHP